MNYTGITEAFLWPSAGRTFLLSKNRQYWRVSFDIPTWVVDINGMKKWSRAKRAKTFTIPYSLVIWNNCVCSRDAKVLFLFRLSTFISLICRMAAARITYRLWSIIWTIACFLWNSEIYSKICCFFKRPKTHHKS